MPGEHLRCGRVADDRLIFGESMVSAGPRMSGVFLTSTSFAGQVFQGSLAAYRDVLPVLPSAQRLARFLPVAAGLPR